MHGSVYNWDAAQLQTSFLYRGIRDMWPVPGLGSREAMAPWKAPCVGTQTALLGDGKYRLRPEQHRDPAAGLIHYL